MRKKCGLRTLVTVVGLAGLAGAAACAAQVRATAARPVAPARPAAAQREVATARPVAAVQAGGTASRLGALPDFGNPNGHFPVPPAGRALNTTHPNHVIGHGTPASCTSAAVVRAVAAGGITRFNCGSRPVTILMTATASVPKTRHLVVLDGGGLVTPSGGGPAPGPFSPTCAGQ